VPQLIVTVEGVEIKHVYLAKDRTLLGRKEGNDIVLDNAAVSSQHCAFELKGLADVFVEDLGSTNGTFVNNARIKRHKLQDDDVVAIAGFRIRYLQASEESGFGATAVMTMGATPQVALGSASFRVLTGSSAGLESAGGQGGVHVRQARARRSSPCRTGAPASTPPISTAPKCRSSMASRWATTRCCWPTTTNWTSPAPRCCSGSARRGCATPQPQIPQWPRLPAGWPCNRRGGAPVRKIGPCSSNARSRPSPGPSAWACTAASAWS
jgi:hypothetical protein